MKRTMRLFPSRTIVVAVTVSLLVGGVGSATAARLVTGKQIKNGSIQFADLSKAAKNKLRGQTGGPGTQGAQGAQGAQGMQGAQGNSGPRGTALAFATIDGGTGAVNSAESSGVTDAMVDRDATGTYCFSELPAGTKSAVVTAESAGIANTAADRIAMIGFSPSGSPNWSGCSAATDVVRVTTMDAGAAALADTDFHIWFEG